MMQRYEIGKKPLSRLLGWGDTTVMRYLDGVEPNREFAAKIECYAENPWEYANLLEENKEKLTDTAYRKTKKAVYNSTATECMIARYGAERYYREESPSFTGQDNG